MTQVRVVLAVIAVLGLAGCMESTGQVGTGFDGFGGFGGTSTGSLVLGRDACLTAAREQGLDVVRVGSVQENGFVNGVARGVRVRLEVRRDPLSVNTEPRVCRYTYYNGFADISRT